VDLHLQDIRWRAFLSDRQVAKGSAPDGQFLPSDRETPVELTALVSAPALGLAVADLIRLQSKDVVIEVDATAVACGVHVTRHVRLNGFDLRLDAGDLSRLLLSTTGGHP
jgi:hypothetical protein